MKLHLEVLGRGVGNRGRGAGRQARKSFLKATAMQTWARKRQHLNFCVPSLATPPIRERRRQLIKQLRGLGRVIHCIFLMAREMPWPGTRLAPPLMTLSDLVLQALAPALGMPPFAPDTPPASPTAVCSKDQRPLLYSLVQALLGHKKPHHPPRPRK